MTEPSKTAREVLQTEIKRQCGIGAGEFSVDDGYGQSGLWQVSADLDPTGLSAAMEQYASMKMAEALRAASNAIRARASEGEGA